MKDVRIAWVELTVTDLAGGKWYGYGYAPMDDGFPCSGGSVYRIQWHPSSTAIVDAVDMATDLALIRIEANGLSPMTLERKEPETGSPLVAIGIPRGKETVRIGSVLTPCHLKFDTRANGMTAFHSSPMLSMSLELERGMSGGPTADGATLLGINAQIDGGQPVSYAISGNYAAHWYDWVRGRASHPPSVTCAP